MSRAVDTEVISDAKYFPSNANTNKSEVSRFHVSTAHLRFQFPPPGIYSRYLTVFVAREAFCSLECESMERVLFVWYNSFKTESNGLPRKANENACFDQYLLI